MITGPAERGFVPVMGLGGDGREQAGFIPHAHIQSSSQQRNEDWTGWAEKFVGAPYKWGGGIVVLYGRSVTCVHPGLLATLGRV